MPSALLPKPAPWMLPPMTDPRALLIRAAEAIPAEFHAHASRETILDAALSMACGMLEGLLDPDPVLAGLAARMYRARLAKLETEQTKEPQHD